MIPGPTSHSFVSQRLRLHYMDWGNPDAPPLLLLHGGRDHCRSWDWVAQELCADWRVIVPDLRGHGDSAWSPDGDYAFPAFVYDLAQLVHRLQLDQLTIVGHSLGGNIAVRYAGLYPERLRKLVSIEGLGPSPKLLAERQKIGLPQEMRDWIENKRRASGRQPRRYPSIEAAYARMKEENDYLTDDQARHLTIHGVDQNEDGTFSWKFDNYIHLHMPLDLTPEQLNELWRSISCPTLLCYGERSWASNPQQDGRAEHFTNAKVVTFPDAGHWLHHDRFDMFMSELRAFL